ncbi:MAG: hypothetical protein IPL46_00370 [Saprospiraceae bacterium]|nr:hypothetical protein [Saprospiraceae bacterium]
MHIVKDRTIIIKMAVNTIKLALLLLVSMSSFTMSGQNGDDTTYRQQYEIEYQQRIKFQKINGHYIPKDVDDSMAELDKIVDMVGKAKFKAQPEEVAVRQIHFSFGRWMIVNWGFYEGSRLSHYLKELGVTYPDDMASVLMACYHRHLNSKPLGLEDLAKSYAEKRKKEVEERLLKGQIIESRTIPKN